MYILKNYTNNDSDIKAIKSENKIVLTSEKGKIMQFSKKEKEFCKFYVILEDKTIRKAEVQNFSKKIVLEKDENDYKVSKSELLLEFGNKRTKKMVKNAEMTGEKIRDFSAIEDSMLTNQISLPNLNENATTPTECYKLDVMFKKKFLKFVKLKNPTKLRLKIERLEEYATEYKIIDVLSSYLKKTTSKEIFYKIPSEIEVFQKNDPVSLKKHKLQVVIYILLLITNNFKLKVEQVPKFDTKQKEIDSIFSIIGCSKRNDVYSLVNWPSEKVSSKKMKKNMR